jgi:uncharacterized phage protein gp47/JayE
MAITGQSFSSIVTNVVAQTQAAAKAAVDFTVGSVPLALAQSIAGLALWLQALILQVLAFSRAATSQGPDLDSWMADFGFPRLGATAAAGTLTFARFQPTSAAVILPGMLAAASIGGAQFVVTLDTTNGLYSSSAGGPGIPGYVIAPSVSSGTVPAAAATPGSGGNVTIGAIGLLLQTVSGIDTVTNGTIFSGGMDAESDPAFRLRFQAFINSLQKGTVAAFAYALNSLRPGLTFSILENTTPNLVSQKGTVTIVLDDGSGNPPLSLMQAAAVAIEAVRCAGITVFVIPPTILPANIVMALTSVVTAQHAADVAAAIAALQFYIDTIPVGGALPYARLAQIAFDASPNISNVTGVTLNAASVVPTSQGAGNAVGDRLTLSDGVVVQVMGTAIGGAVTAASVMSVGSVSSSATGLTVASSTGTGTGAIFSLTIGAGLADLGSTATMVIKAGAGALLVT